MSEQHIRFPLLNSCIEHWAKLTPDKPAMIQHEDGKTVTYKQFLSLIDFFALRLLDLGIRPGDRIATMLVLVPEHLILMYACFRIGAMIAPLDVRLKNEEVLRDLNKIKPKIFFFLGNTPVRDFREVGRAVKERCPYVEHLVQFTADPKPGDILDGAIGVTEMMDKKRLLYLKVRNIFTRRLEKTYAAIEPRTPALIIYTTGTTGEPKPALLCHENILVQNELIHRGVGMGSGTRLLINVPPSHVGCVTQNFMSLMYVGATAVLLRIFDVRMTLEAIEKWKVNVVVQLPTQYRMLWAHPDYDKHDLSSLKLAVYMGSAVDVEFLKRLSKMAPRFGTGIGMTENAGAATLTPLDIPPEEMAGQVGRPFPDLAPVTIRKPMSEEGAAGEELPDGEIGEICYHGPIVFLGYYNQPEETAKAVSKDGILYTGDLGYFKDMGSYRALFLAGRRKFVIKQKGYNVFPGEVEAHIAQLEGVDAVQVVGVKHRLFDEGILAFVRRQKDADLTAETVMEHCKNIAAYKRPQHVELWPPEKEFPLTRVLKVDRLALHAMAEPIVEQLRRQGAWDA